MNFEAVFGPGGVWTRLLQQGSGYLGTELWYEAQASGQYRVKDFWAWHRDFEKFRSAFQLEYERFENWILSDGLIEREQFLGAYYEKRDGEDNRFVLT